MLDRERRFENREILLEKSPHESDGGELVGKIPAEVPSEVLALAPQGERALKAIPARCLDCCCDSASEVRKCVAVECPSWPFRMGKDPFRQTRTLSDEQRQKMAERLRNTKAA